MTAQKKSLAGAARKSGATVRIKWVVSFIGCPRGMRQTIRGLGFRRMQQVVEREDTAATRGMIHKVRHLVEVHEDVGEKKREKVHDKVHEKKHQTEAKQSTIGERS